ncbi:MAG TPA: AbrB/MazE/SpoVT family DNA-binding domain-containing protein [Ktedonobacteraceae bacterium]|nr:AbrB/MazE/SpoVT family DNA-binding domain-containing protein [Ktedonobacteraceae bacterium]
MLMQKLRKVGNSFVVTIPKEEAERQNLQEGDMVGIEVRKVHLKPEMSPEVKAAFERSWKAYEADYRYLAER